MTTHLLKHTLVLSGQGIVEEAGVGEHAQVDYVVSDAGCRYTPGCLAMRNDSERDVGERERRLGRDVLQPGRRRRAHLRSLCYGCCSRAAASQWPQEATEGVSAARNLRRHGGLWRFPPSFSHFIPQSSDLSGSATSAAPARTRRRTSGTKLASSTKTESSVPQLALAPLLFLARLTSCGKLAAFCDAPGPTPWLSRSPPLRSLPSLSGQSPCCPRLKRSS
jgi:hypothetical protein